MYANRFGKLSPFANGRTTTKKRQELPLLLLLTFVGENEPLKVGHVKFDSQINYKSNSPIMREISSLGQSHKYGDDANIDFVRQY